MLSEPKDPLLLKERKRKKAFLEFSESKLILFTHKTAIQKLITSYLLLIIMNLVFN